MTRRAAIILAVSVFAGSCGKATSLEEHEARQTEVAAPGGARATPALAPADE